jgi:hypothetical protein
MAKYKVELVFDTVAAGFPGWRHEEIEACMKCVTGVLPSVKADRLPDPPIKQRFIVEIESPLDLPVIQPHHVRNFFFSMTPISPERTVTVTPG